MRNSNLYYIYADHLNTPRAITDIANNLQWTWENKEAFGNNLPTEVVSGFKFNFRLPGQYFDSRTNLNYNIHRDYNPVWGRYMSSDPLGLAAGINTYGYVSGNSLVFSDRLGLEQGNLYQRGYPHVENNRGESHWYEVENLICDNSNPNCNKNNVSDLLKLYPTPMLCLTPGCRTSIKTGDKNIAFSVGNVVHTVCNNLVINTTIPNQHILSPGVIIREVVERNGNIYVQTLGFGTEYFGKLNTDLANWTWQGVDANISFSIRKKQ